MKFDKRKNNQGKSLYKICSNSSSATGSKTFVEKCSVSLHFFIAKTFSKVEQYCNSTLLVEVLFNTLCVSRAVVEQCTTGSRSPLPLAAVRARNDPYPVIRRRSRRRIQNREYDEFTVSTELEMHFTLRRNTCWKYGKYTCHQKTLEEEDRELR